MSDIVIDADIMRSAGTSEHPHSSHARQILEAIRDGGHRMVQCAPLMAEHRKHQGRFASAWRTSMVSRKQWVQWHYQEDAVLRETLVAALPSEFRIHRGPMAAQPRGGSFRFSTGSSGLIPAGRAGRGLLLNGCRDCRNGDSRNSGSAPADTKAVPPGLSPGRDGRPDKSEPRPRPGVPRG